VRQSVLIVDDEELIRRSVRIALEGAGYSVALAASGTEALRQLQDDPPDCVVIDLRLGDADGLDVLRTARARQPHLKAIVITAHGDVDSAVQALRLGAFDFIKKPFDLDEVLAAVANALHADVLERQVAHYSGRSDEWVFASDVMRATLQHVEKVAVQPVPVVLVLGETGTGKELAARAIHQRSPRARGPFIERGAFSDAREQKRGLVELADGGTLFLDEVGDLPAAAQAKLLKFVETLEFRRVGGTKLLSVDCRVVAATHRRLDESATFRRDLYYRLAGVTITMPPLRDRGDDVLLLARHFLARDARRYHKTLTGFTPDAEALLRAHRWPGNVRELKAAISAAVVMAEDGAIGIDALAPVQRAMLSTVTELPASADGIMTIEQLQLAYVARVLALCGGNKVLAAQRLDISRQTLARWIADPPDAS